MSSTDFFDDDLAKPREHASFPSSVSIDESMVSGSGTGGKSGQGGKGKNGSAGGSSSNKYSESGRVVSDIDLARMSKHREHLEGQATQTLTEIEQLKQRTDDLEVERRQLEDLRRKQDAYVNSKREMMQRLNQSVLAIEKEEVKASQLVELYGDTRQRFRKMLGEIEHIDESTWPEETAKDELSKAQDLIDSVRVECSKSLVKLDTYAMEDGNGFAPVSGSSGRSVVGKGALQQPFTYWLKVGLAISLPLSIFFGGVSFIVYMTITQWMR